MLPEGLFDKNLEGSFGSLKLKTLALQVLQVIEDLSHFRIFALQINFVLRGFVKDIRFTREVRDENPLTVSNTFWRNMFVGSIRFSDSAYMQTPFVGKGTFPHIREVFMVGEV